MPENGGFMGKMIEKARQCGQSYALEMLENARADERRNCAEVTISKLQKIAARVQSEQLSPAATAGFIQSEIDKIEAEIFI